MQQDQLILMNLPKSFDIADLPDYMPQDGSHRYDSLDAEGASVVFRYNGSSTGVLAIYNPECRMLTLHLSRWANECDVHMCAFLTNSLLRNNKRMVLRFNYMPRDFIGDHDIESMVTSRKQFLKRCIFTNEEFHMEGLFQSLTVKTDELPAGETTEQQAEDLMAQFTAAQWE